MCGIQNEGCIGSGKSALGQQSHHAFMAVGGSVHMDCLMQAFASGKNVDRRKQREAKHCAKASRISHPCQQQLRLDRHCGLYVGFKHVRIKQNSDPQTARGVHAASALSIPTRRQLLNAVATFRAQAA